MARTAVAALAVFCLAVVGAAAAPQHVEQQAREPSAPASDALFWPPRRRAAAAARLHAHAVAERAQSARGAC
jgi:hypothetical protein